MGDEHGHNTIAFKRRGPWLYVTEDPARKVALLRGDGAPNATRVLSDVYDEFIATWSRSMRGYVIPLRFVPDVEAYCQNEHQLCVVSVRKEAS